MSPRRPGSAALSLAAFFGFLLLVAPRPVAAGDSQESTETPISVLSQLERFWSEQTADSLIARIDPDEIRLSFRTVGPRDGTFDHTQARYLLADLFSFARTDSFFFVEFEFDPTGNDPPEAVGHWYFKAEAGVDREARVTLQLAPHAGRWMISSIEAKKW
jgi:hypothetical protein